MAAGGRAVQAAALGGAALVLFVGGLLLPAGGFLTVVSPIPLLVLAGRRGLPLTAAVGAGAALMAFALEARAAAAFLLQVAAPALAMGAAARRAKTPVPPVLAGAGAGLVGVALLVGWGVGFRPGAAVAAVGTHVDGVLNDLVAGASRMGLPGEQVRELASWMGGLRDAVVALLPGLLATAWAFIGAGILTLLPGPARPLGLNLFVAVIGLYFLEGVAVAADLARRYRLPPGLWAFGLLLLLLQPLTAFAVAALGLFDVWCGFRRRERTAR
ncbi:MAG: DUF2232 domain-containing protein [candidate division NC10 bacterium]|nr:DUF2232 domain-containing protein [candidate division NC10 bacterium]